MAIVPTRSGPVTGDDNLQRKTVARWSSEGGDDHVTPAASPVARVCDICESDIEIATNVVTLPGPKKSTFTICGDCFELYRLCPGPRPTV